MSPVTPLLFVLLFLAALHRTCVAAGATDPVPARLTLEEARRQVVARHPGITAAQLRALAARQVTREATAALLPQLSANVVAVGAADDNTRLAALGSLNNPSIFDRNAEGLSLTQLVTDFGRSSRLRQAAGARALGENDAALATREQLLLQVDVAYFGVLRSRAIDGIAAETVNARQKLLDQITAYASNKLRSELDLSFARVGLEEALLLRSRASNDVQAAYTTLAALLSDREPIEYPLVDVAPPPDLTNGVAPLVAQALARRPDLMRYRHEQQAAADFARAERALAYPTLSIAGSAGVVPLHDSHLPDSYAAGGLILNVPLYSGGLLGARRREAELRAEAAGEKAREAENEVVRDVRLAWLRARNTQDRLRIAGDLERHATLAYELARARYETGASSIVELANAQLSQVTAAITRTETRYAYLADRAVLDYQTGSPP